VSGQLDALATLWSNNLWCIMNMTCFEN